MPTPETTRPDAPPTGPPDPTDALRAAIDGNARLIALYADETECLRADVAGCRAAVTALNARVTRLAAEYGIDLTEAEVRS